MTENAVDEKEMSKVELQTKLSVGLDKTSKKLVFIQSLFENVDTLLAEAATTEDAQIKGDNILISKSLLNVVKTSVASIGEYFKANLSVVESFDVGVELTGTTIGDHKSLIADATTTVNNVVSSVKNAFTCEDNDPSQDISGLNAAVCLCRDAIKQITICHICVCKATKKACA